MPKIKAVLTLEFEADSSDPDAIDLALDQVLVVQPSCKILSKMIAEVDGEVVDQGSAFSLDSTRSGLGRPLSIHQNGVYGNSCWPEYPDRDRDRRIDSYRLHSSDFRPFFQPSDSYKPKGYAVPNSGGVDSDGQKGFSLPQKTDYGASANGDVPSAGPLGLGTRYDVLVDSMIFGARSDHLRRGSRGSRVDHYSLQYRPDRSASPPTSLRRSERLRDAPSNDFLRPLRKSKDSDSDLRCWASSKEMHESGSWKLKQRREEDEKQFGAEPGSLEALAPKMVAKDLAAGGRAKFEKQQERHGIAEALRLRNLRSTQKIQKARLKSDEQRWTGDKGRQESRIDAIIDQITLFDFSTGTHNNNNDNSGGGDAATSHAAVETRKKKKKKKEKKGADGREVMERPLTTTPTTTTMVEASDREAEAEEEEGAHMDVLTHDNENERAASTLPLLTPSSHSEAAKPD